MCVLARCGGMLEVGAAGRMEGAPGIHPVDGGVDESRPDEAVASSQAQEQSSGSAGDGWGRQRWPPGLQEGQT